MVIMINRHSTLRGFKTSDKGLRIDIEPGKTKDIPQELVDRALKNDLEVFELQPAIAVKKEPEIPKKKVK